MFLVKLSWVTLWELSQLHYRKRYASEFVSMLHFINHKVRLGLRRKITSMKLSKGVPETARRTYLAPRLPKANIVTFANGKKFEKTSQRIIKSLGQFNGLSLTFDVVNLTSIKSRPWFSKIADFPERPVRPGRRDGYYCAYKPWIIQDSIKESSPGSVTYFVDSSQYYRVGFYENIEPLIKTIFKEGKSPFYGSAMPGFLEEHQGWTESHKSLFLERANLGLGLDFFSLPALLTSSMLFINDSSDRQLVERWADACDYEMVSLNHTVEQSVLMAFLANENRSVLNLAMDHRVGNSGFEVSHSLGKNHNLVHKLFSKYGASIFSTLNALQRN